MNADRLTITNNDSIPIGTFQDVAETDYYDLRVARNLGKSISKIANNGYDDNFCVTRGSDQALTFVARYLNNISGFFYFIGASLIINMTF